jgi:HrpA-like RNA helicase
MAVATRVAAERHVQLGFDVGYALRFEDRTSERTKIRYVTDGKLLMEFLLDPFLSAYSTIMIDEAHERSVGTDILSSLLKDLVIARQLLRIVIASATLDAEKMSLFFGNAPITYVPGRRFDVEIRWADIPTPDSCQTALATIIEIHRATQIFDGLCDQ